MEIDKFNNLNVCIRPNVNYSFYKSLLYSIIRLNVYYRLINN